MCLNNHISIDRSGLEITKTSRTESASSQKNLRNCYHHHHLPTRTYGPERKCFRNDEKGISISVIKPLNQLTKTAEKPGGQACKREEKKPKTQDHGRKDLISKQRNEEEDTSIPSPSTDSIER
jgi:hypothetical protein